MFGPWRSTEFYANWGWGFHSNSGLGVVLSVDPVTGDPVTPSTPSPARRAPSSASATWPCANCKRPRRLVLRFDSELIYVGDSGSTEAGPSSRRYGLEFTNYIYPNPWVAMDLDLSFSQARFLDVPEDEAFVPGALNSVISGGIAVNPPAGVRAGPFPGSGSATSGRGHSSRKQREVEVDEHLQRRGRIQALERIRLTPEAYNLFDAEVSDIDYFFESRLRDEPEPVEDIHFHAAIPRSARLLLQVSF